MGNCIKINIKIYNLTHSHIIHIVCYYLNSFTKKVLDNFVNTHN